jgi:hypothetical protein
MSKGIYNATYFVNYPEEQTEPGILYCVILVNNKTLEREVLKIGIAKGKTWKDAVKRSFGFKGYELRIQRVYSATLKEVWELEVALHTKWAHKRKAPLVKFAGHTECFCPSILSEVLLDIPKNSS